MSATDTPLASSMTTPFFDAVRADPAEAVVLLGGLIALTLGSAIVLRRLHHHLRSLRNQVLAVTLVALGVGAAATLALARLMVLDEADSRTVIGVLFVTALFAVVLVFVASGPLGRDARQLESTVRLIEDGDRDVRTGVSRSDELGHVARAVDAMVARLGELERERASYEAERSNLLTSVSHDLRTPLAALRAAAEALADGVAPDPERFVRSMQHDISALTTMVDDLFLLTRVEAGRLALEPAPLDLAEIADEAIEALTPVAATRGIDLALRCGARVPVVGNAAALGRVIRNLVDNAIRHAPDRSTVTVALDGSGPATLRVVDEGPGFPAGFEHQAFDRFSRADSSRGRATGGAGLGLAIARGLVEAHGGRIWIEPAPGGRVAFELPAA